MHTRTADPQETEMRYRLLCLAKDIIVSQDGETGYSVKDVIDAAEDLLVFTYVVHEGRDDPED